MKKIVVLYVFLGIIVAISPILAISNLTPATLSTPGAVKTLNLPAAADHSPVISLGQAIDPQSGELVEGYAIIHYKDSEAKSNSARGRGTTCYGYLASGAKWKVNEPCVINAATSRGLDPNAVFTTQANGITKWENAAGFDILGNGTITSDALIADTSAPDDKNEVYFGSISDSNAIAVTIVWGIFSGPTFQRKLGEWDQ